MYDHKKTDFRFFITVLLKYQVSWVVNIDKRNTYLTTKKTKNDQAESKIRVNCQKKRDRPKGRQQWFNGLIYYKRNSLNGSVAG